MRPLPILLLLLTLAAAAAAQTRTIGLLLHDSARAFRGFTLFAPLSSTTTYLINNDGMLIRSWKSASRPGQAAMLLPDGSLLRAAMTQGNPFTAGGVGGRVERFDWNGTLVWTFDHVGPQYSTHHDIEVLPNGNILLIAWEKKTLAEAWAAGRDTTGHSYSEVWSEKVIEVRPRGSSGGDIVWEWHVWDHLVQDVDPSRAHHGVVHDHPELYDINVGDMKNDWLHFNAIRYNAERDEVMVSIHATHEFFVIDHGTTTAEAAGHSGGRQGRGGDILYRWGNPRNYDLGTAGDQRLYGQHDARWIEAGRPGAGHILVFNNGTRRPGGQYSTIEELAPPLDEGGAWQRAAGAAFGPIASTWQYTATPPTSFYSQNISGATRQPNGTTLICEGGSGRMFEVTPDGTTVWTYVNPVNASGPIRQGATPTENAVFKCLRLPPDFPGFAGRDLTPLGPIEASPTEAARQPTPDSPGLWNQPNPFSTSTLVTFALPRGGRTSLTVHDALGRRIAVLVDDTLPAGMHSVRFSSPAPATGPLYLRLSSGGVIITRTIIATAP